MMPPNRERNTADRQSGFVHSIVKRIFPPFDGRYDGHLAALWLLAIHVALKLVMSLNSILLTAKIAGGADGLPLDSFGAEAASAVMMLFALLGLGQLTLALASLAVLVRWRALVPFFYLLLIIEHVARRLIVESYAVARTETVPSGVYVNYALLALLGLGLVLSLRRTARP